MPPVRKAGGQQFQKDVAFVTKDDDDDEQVAAGIVMVPDKADLQHDFVREDTIQQFADQFQTFVDEELASGGIMHAVWPDDWMELERNEVLDEAEEIGGQEVAAGAWVQEWAINHDELWELILADIIAGYSIGARNVDWNGPFEQGDDEVDDVEVPDDLPDDALIWELTDGLIFEVSAVDIPAVPDAEILEAKALEKRLGQHLGNHDAFIEEAQQRGHTEAEAEQLWDVLTDAVEVEGSGEPGKQSTLRQAAKAFISTLTGADDGTETTSPEDPDTGAAKNTAAKEGRTLSTANQRSAMAAVDSNLEILEDAGVDHGMTRFTDRDEFDFDLSEHTAREWPDAHDEGGEGDETDEDTSDDAADVSPINNAADGDEGGDGDDGEDEEDEDDVEASAANNASDGETSESGSTDAAADTDTDTDTDMSDDNTDGEGDKSLAEKNAEQLEKNAERIDNLTSAVEDLTETIAGGGEEKTVELEIGGEIYEVTESEAKSWFDDEDGDGKEADADDPITALKDTVESLESRLDTISQQSGVSGKSTQIRDPGRNSDDSESGLDQLGKVLS